MKWRRLVILVEMSILMLSAAWAGAETISQSFTLHPGWNAIFLEVEPASTAPSKVFSDIAGLQSVWMWNPETGTVEFIQDPGLMEPDQPQWLVYFPGTPVASNLYAVHANTAYLVNLSGTADVPLIVTGEPGLPIGDWKADSFNFTGFHVVEGNEPFFADFFSSSPAHADLDIYLLNNIAGTWEKVENPASTTMKKGEAFWVYCKGSSVFTGPLSVQPEQSDGLFYGKILSEQNITVFNHSDTDMAAVELSFSALTENFYYWTFDETQGQSVWQAFPATLALTIKAGESREIRLGLKRAGLDAEPIHQANLSIKETVSSRMELLVPVSVTGISYAGLWVGNATINKVNEPANTSDGITPMKTGSEFSFRLIIHVDGSLTARLLSQVTQMWQEGTWKPDPNDSGKLIVDQPGSFVLLADDTLIPNYSGSALLDGRPVGRRISTAAFPRIKEEDRIMLGAMDPTVGNTLTTITSITLAADDPTNPFRHLYHPDHQPDSSYEVTRKITLTFSDTDTDGNPIPGIFAMTQGSSQVGGIYRETITGLHRDSIKIEGVFSLNKVSEIANLTTRP